MNTALDRPWRPLLAETHALRARAIVDDIRVALRHAGKDEPSLYEGWAGRALFFDAVTRFGDDEREMTARCLDRAAEQLALAPSGAYFFGGFSGVAWAAELLEPDGEDGNGDIDDALLQLLSRPWTATYDLVAGLVGLGIYALGRAHRPSGRACAARIVELLAERVEPRAGGCSWRTDPAWLSPTNRLRHGGGHYNLGVAHGVPGVIVFLAGACAAGIAVDRARPLLDGAVHWLWSVRLPEDSPSLFDYQQRDDAAPTPARLAWCYGDPGVAAALAAAALAVDEPLWLERAVAAGLRASRRTDDGGVRDAGLCHGSAGVALLFHRLWQASGCTELADAARRWYAHTIDQCRPGTGVAGYRSYQPQWESRPAHWRDDAAFLTGSCGIGLALLAGLGVEPTWDRALAASLPTYARRG